MRSLSKTRLKGVRLASANIPGICALLRPQGYINGAQRTIPTHGATLAAFRMALTIFAPTSAALTSVATLSTHILSGGSSLSCSCGRLAPLAVSRFNPHQTHIPSFNLLVALRPPAGIGAATRTSPSHAVTRQRSLPPCRTCLDFRPTLPCNGCASFVSCFPAAA